MCKSDRIDLQEWSRYFLELAQSLSGMRCHAKISTLVALHFMLVFIHNILARISEKPLLVREERRLLLVRLSFWPW